MRAKGDSQTGKGGFPRRLRSAHTNAAGHRDLDIGEASGQICDTGTFASMSSAPIRTNGSGSASALRARLMIDDEGRDPSSFSAAARATPGALWSDATMDKSAAASAASVQAAWNASA